MSQVVDSKVVEMQFDNSRFERNVEQSMSTLDKLKAKLNMSGTTKGLEDVEKAARQVDLSGIADGVEAIQQRFSTMGIVGMTVIQNLTSAAMSYGARMIAFAKNSIVGGGMRRAQNIENAHFMLQGLLDTEKEVQAVMDKAMESVDQTAYGYDEAAKAAAMFTASGLKVNQLERPLRAITGVAAVTNSEYERVSQIFTTVAGNGRLMGDQLLQLSSMGLNAAATIADYYNEHHKGSKKTEEDIRKMVSEGKISFKEFSNAMNSAFGDQAKKANETINGVISNIKAAFSRIGADFISPLIEQKGPLVELLNEVRERINEIRKKATGPAAEEITKSLNRLFKGLRNFLHMQDFNWLAGGLLEIFRIIKDIARIGYNLFRPMVTAIGDVIEPARYFANILWTVRQFLDSIVRATSGKVFDNLTMIFSNLAYVIGELLDPIYKFIVGLAPAAKETTKFQKVLVIITDALVRFTDGLADGIDKVKNFTSPFTSFVAKIASGIGMILSAIKEGDVIGKIKSALKKLVTSIKQAFKDTFGEFQLDDSINLFNAGAFIGLIKLVEILIKKLRTLQWSGLKLEGLQKIYRLFSNDLRDTLFEYQRKLKADQLIGIAKAIAVLAVSLLLISMIKPERLALGLAGMAQLFTMLAGFFVLFNGNSALGIKGMSNAASLMTITKMITAINGIATAMLILSGALKIISTIDPESMERSIMAIGILLLELGLFVNNINTKGFSKGAIGLIALSAGLLLLSFAVKSFAKMDMESMFRGLMGVATALATILLTMKLMPEKGMITTGIGLIAVAAGLLIIGRVIKNLGSLDDGVLNRGLGGLAGLLIELSIALQVMKGTLAGSAALIVAAVSIGILVPILILLSKVSWEGIAKGLIFLAGAFTIIGVAGKILDALAPTLLVLAGALLGFSASVALLGAGLVLIGVGFTAIAAGLTALATAITARASLIITAIKIIVLGLIGLIPSIIKGLAAAFVTSIDVIFEYAPTLINGLWKFIIEILKGLDKYITQIADLFLSFAIKAINVIAKRVPELVTAFANLASAVFKALSEAFKNVDTESLLKGILAVGLMAGLTYILSSIVSMIPMDMVGLAGMGAMIAELSLILAAIWKLSEISGLTWLVSEGGNFLQAIGTAIGQFIGGIIGGVGQGITASLPEMGTNLSQFMTNLKPFLDGASTINPSMAEGIKALAAAILMITAADVLESVTSWLTGGVDMAEFAAKLVPFGEGLKAYSQSVAGMDAKAVKTSAVAAKSIAELAKALPNSGGLVALFSGDNDIGKFGPQIKTFGEGLKEYAVAVAGIDLTAVQNAEKAVKSMVNTINSTAEVDTSGVSSFKSAVGSLGQVQADQMAKAFKTNAGALKDAGQSMTSALQKGLNSGKGELKSTASSMMASVSKAFTSSAGDLSSTGSKVMANLIKGINSRKRDVVNAVKIVMSAAASAAKDFYGNFESSGERMAQGLADGISAKQSTVVNAAASLAQAAIDAANKKLKINSPSKVFRAIGSGIVEGFVQGVDQNVNQAVSATTNMADRSVRGFSKALSSLNTIVGEEMDTNPTITPVLDLSAVQEGSGYISNMLDMASSIGLDTNTGPINTLLNNNMRNTLTNGDVVTAIDKLNRNLANMEGNTYTINGVTYDDGSNISNAVEEIFHAAMIERRS